MRKSQIRSLLQADLGMIMRERTSPLFGINQMLVSDAGERRVITIENHVKIGPLRKLTCERKNHVIKTGNRRKNHVVDHVNLLVYLLEWQCVIRQVQVKHAVK